MFRKIVLMIGLIISPYIQAGGWSDYREITKVGVRADSAAGFYFTLAGGPNPDNCSLVDHYFVRSPSPMMAEMYSLVLAAKKSNMKITAQLDGCDNGRPKVISVMEAQ